MDRQLRFHDHISIIYKKNSQRVPTGTKLWLFKAAILPYLTYCHLVWHFCRASDSIGNWNEYRKGHSELFTVTGHQVMKNY